MARNPKLPSRGPRVMHGMSAMLAKAADLRGLRQQPGAPRMPSDEDIAREAQETAQAVQAVAVVMRQMHNVELVLTAFESQLRMQPADCPFRALAEKMCVTLRDAIKAGETA